MQSFKKIGVKLYEELCSCGTHCLHIEGEKISPQCGKKKSGKKKKKKNLTIISKPHAHPQVQSFKKIGIKLYEELCSCGTHCLYIEDEKRLSPQCGKKKKI